MARKRKEEKKKGGRGNPSKHPGVVLVKRKRDGITRWRARFKDPDTGRTVYETLDARALSSTEAREGWAKKKAKSIALRAAEIASGAPVRTSTPFSGAVEGYLSACENRLRPRTVASYRYSLAVLTGWAKGIGLDTVEALSPPHLAEFREHLIGKKVRRAAKKGKRGAKKETRDPRSPFYVNHYLREVGAFLGEMRRQGRTPLLSRDTIADGLRSLNTPRPLPRPLAPKDCKALLRAALAHDAETWKITRREHAEQPSAAVFHKTPRYRPVAPLMAFVLLSGCRIGEALSLRWQDVNLDAPGDDGSPVGEVRLQSGAVKTAQERIVDLSIAPGLRALLGRLRLRAGSDRFVFGGDSPYKRDDAENGRKRTIRKYGAPAHSWQVLRQTCASYLVNAPGIFRAAATFRAAAQLGHSSAVADRHYRGLLRGIPATARTVEAAMGIEEVLPSIAAVAVEEPAAVAG